MTWAVLQLTPSECRKGENCVGNGWILWSNCDGNFDCEEHCGQHCETNRDQPPPTPHTGTLKLQAIADSLASLLGQLSNVYTTHTAALQYDCVVLVDKAAALQKELNATLERFDDVQSRASDIEGCVRG